MQILSLDQYNIYIGSIWDELNSFLEKNNYSRHFIIVDENTTIHCLPDFIRKTNLIQPIIIETRSGELFKNIRTCQQIWTEMMEHKGDRKSLTINLGGGVIGDMGGFCASTYKRGMDFIQVPTTLLSQVDSSIGGKLGIDFADVKNSIGLFRDPQAVFIDSEFLETLSNRQIRSGLAEMIKHALIADKDQWDELANLRDFGMANWARLIPPSLSIKKDIVEKDPYENNIRKALNFGHTIGHAIESTLLESSHPLLHGEAIAAGMICELYLSNKIVGLPSDSLPSISKKILDIYGHVSLDESTFGDMIQLMMNDKKNEDGKINFSLIDTPGSVKINQTADSIQIVEALNYYRLQ